MRGKVVEDFVIPAKHGRGFVVRKGQVMRIHLVEARQVGDCAFFNADDPKEVFHVGQSWALNVMHGTGTSKSFQHFYSKPPRENIMFTTLEDTVRNHWGNNGGRCSPAIYSARKAGPQARSCQLNLTEAVAPFGLSADDIMDVFNVFMNVELTTDGKFKMMRPETVVGDHIDMRAEMNVLAAISACPAEDSPTNDYAAKPLGVTIFAS